MSRGKVHTHRKQDSGKRVFWQRMIRDQARAGLSVRAWCRRHQLSEPAFYWWRRRIGRCGTSGRGPATSVLAPVHVVAESDEALIEIVLSGDRRVRLRGRVDRQVLVDVLAALNRCVHPPDDRAGSRAEARPC